ncbi:XAC0095 family protein [Luteimonas sp. SDU101]|uniref:XAC0095 family protein n=1 Tax=Luteimonas sp. SDU101 TaxID=3422593 RepID=UPI003EBAB457
MSTHDEDEMETLGYFLPEDSEFRLRKLRDYMMFLSRLAQPRSADEAHPFGRRPDLRTADLEICLELLAEQAQIVLDEVTWPAEREVQAAGAEEGDGPEAEADAAARRYVFGITGGQFDALERLVEALAAHGDVMAGSDGATVASQALSLVGQAVCNGMDAVRAILDDVEAQPLVQPVARKDVGEERAVYGARLAGPMLSRTTPAAQQGWRVLH